MDDYQWRPTNPADVPAPEPVSNEDFLEAMQNTKAAAKAIKYETYFKWMKEFGSV